MFWLSYESFSILCDIFLPKMFIFRYSSCGDVRNKAVFVILKHSSLSGNKQKKHEKNMKVWLLNLNTRDLTEKLDYQKDEKYMLVKHTEMV